MAQFQVVFYVGEDQLGQLDIEADYYRDIDKTGKTEFIYGPSKSQGTNVVLSINSDEVFYILQKPGAVEPKVEAPTSQLSKFYNRYPQTLSA